MKIERKVKKFGNGGHIVLTKELIGKTAVIEFKDNKDQNTSCCDMCVKEEKSE